MKRAAREKKEVLKALAKALKKIARRPEFTQLIPEVGSNLAYALPHAKGVEQVAGVPGRIRNALGKPVFLAPVFGASRHNARAVLAAQAFEASVRSAVNIRFSKEILRACRELGFVVSSYDRRREPPSVKAREGKSISWGIARACQSAIESAGRVPDVVFHCGDVGKEAMIIVFGGNPLDVVEKIFRILEKMKKAG